MPTVKTQYACFVDPGREQIGLDVDQACPKCGRTYGFMLDRDSLPARIDGMQVIEGISRGFYSAVYKTLDAELGIYYAVKVIPVSFYEPGVFKTDGKDFLSEVKTHIELSKQSMVATFEGRGQDTLRFGEHDIECYWIKMEYVDGKSLEDVIIEGPDNAHQIAQIAYDLLDLLEALDAEGIHHNDLHQRNVKVTEPAKRVARAWAIDNGIQVKVLDWGSVGDVTRTELDAKCGDVRQVAGHLNQLLSAYFRNSMPGAGPQDVRFLHRLRELAVAYLGQDAAHHPRPKDMMDAIKDAYLQAVAGPIGTSSLGSIAAHWNAKTLSPWLVPTLFHDPTGTWLEEVSGAGPTVITGMRGCGKTMLLRSLEWLARVQPRAQADGATERQSEVIDRLTEEAYLGLFVTCQELSSSADAQDTPLRMLLISYALEVLEALDYCSVLEFGQVNYLALESFLALMHELVPWFEPPQTPVIHVAIKGLRKAWGSPLAKNQPDLDLTAFVRLADAIRSLLPVWENKRVLFLLDDVSRRYFAPDDALRLMGTLLYQDEACAFKITTETQTLEFRTPGGQPAMDNRDYRVFDLGHHVLENLKNGGAVRFIDELLYRRAIATPSSPFKKRPSSLLGRQQRKDIAARIHEETRSAPKAKDVYWGITALAGLCVGDIGDVILLYEQILKASEESSHYDFVPHDIQHEQMIRFSSGKLHGLAHDLWLESHAIEFARASHDELKATKGTNWQQLSEVRFSLDSSARRDQLERCQELVDRLVEAGVFVLDGVAARSKTADGPAKIQRRLVYRKVLGLNALIPLSMRHRVELPFARLLDWLELPASSKLRTAEVLENADTGEMGEVDTLPPLEPVVIPDPAVEREQSSVPSMVARQQTLFGPPEPDPDALLGYRIESMGFDGLHGIADWGGLHVVGGFGFEDRSLGLWNALSDAAARPSAATLVAYPGTPGFRKDIEAVLHGMGTRCLAVSQDDMTYRAFAAQLLSGVGSQDVVVDTTALTKPLIYALVKEALVSRGRVWVLHACAQVYEPQDDALLAVAKLLDKRPFANALTELRKLVPGELSPFTPQIVDDPVTDPGQQSVLAAFIPLKFERVESLVNGIRPERTLAIAVQHSSGDKAERSRISGFLAEYFSAESGNAYCAAAMDEVEAFRLLLALYREWALDGTYNFAVSLTGSKMHAVATAMLGSIAPLAGVYYAKPQGYLEKKYTSGTDVNAIQLRRIDRNEILLSETCPE